MFDVAVSHPVIWTSQNLRPWLPQVSVAITSTVLAVFGSDINGLVKKTVKKHPFIVRLSVFVALVTIGYGALNLVLAHLISQLLMKSDDLWLFPIVVSVFIAIGVLAETRRQI